MANIVRFFRQAYPFIIIPLFLVLIFFLMFSFHTVRGDSMEPAMHDGQLVMFSRISYGIRIRKYILRWSKIEKGDIVIFREEKSGQVLVKRCIGTEGDPITAGTDNITVAGRTLSSDYITAGLFGDYIYVPPGHIFVAGENTGVSVDSRFFGFVPIDDVKGKVLYISEQKRQQ